MKWYKHKVLLINLSVALLWLVLVWLSYVLFPNQPWVRVTLSRVVFIGIATQLLVLASQRRRQVLSIIKEFFTEATHPINLAVFRVVLFLTLFIYVSRPSGAQTIVWFSQFPAELQFAPSGLGWLLNYLPINETLAKACCTLLLVCCFTAMIGFFSRTSALLTVIFGFYALGIPQFFGKINHSHHLLWFAAILAASRCGDMFSCDAIRAAWKRADRGNVEPPGPSRTYALPLRFVWLLIGVIYFFSGFWKLWRVGFDWALSDNFKFLLYDKWLKLDGWTPFFRLDQYPLLYKPLALGAIVFELSFIFLIFFPRLRLLAALGGITFHSMINAFMRIHFWTLQTSYVAFLDWNAILRRMGHWLYQEEMYVVYDGNCKLCRRTIASLRVFDILGRVTYVNALDQEAVANHKLDWLDSAAIMTDMHAVVQRKTWIGFSSYRVLAARIPILWPALPFLYVWPIPRIGRKIYRRVADSRTCSVANAPLPKTTAYRCSQRPRLRGVVMVGVFLLSVNILFSIKRVGNSWPFALYPTFAELEGPKTESLEIVPLSSTGETIAWDEQTLKQKFGSARYEALVTRIPRLLESGKDPTQRHIRLKGLWQLMMQNDSSLRQADSVRFYKVILWNIPERQKENPVHRELISELKL